MMRPAGSVRGSPFARLLHYCALALPAFILTLLAAKFSNAILVAAAVMSAVAGIVLSRGFPAWRPPLSGPTALLYLVALGTAWLVTASSVDAFVSLCRGVLFLGVVGVFISHDMYRTGSEPRRKARKWCARLQAREDWPRDLAETRLLPEVYALRDAAEVEPGPVFELFRDTRAQVRAAAFASFIGRPAWRPREAAAVLEEARKSTEPGVRSMAVAALSGIDDPDIVHGLAGFFNDPHEDVRAAAVWAALADGGARWSQVREAVRQTLADPHGKDKALPGAAGRLPVVAICDLSAWAFEAEPLGNRSVRTLIDHYNHVLRAAADYDLITDLSNQVLDPNSATVLRVELASLLRNLGLLTPELLDRMSNADQPGAVRLLAAEAMLALDPYHPDGLDVLRGLGRQPNREMALAIANILHHRLGYDMGLTGEPLPPNSKAAGEVAKRVMAWAVGRGETKRMVTPTPDPFGAPELLPLTPDAMDAPVLQPLEPAAKRKPW